MATETLPGFRFTTRFPFQHIANQDGTSHSMCLRCHRTVASSHNEYSLELAESTHKCPSLHLLPAASAAARPAAASLIGRRSDLGMSQPPRQKTCQITPPDSLH
jgi:hypothetical protein